MSSETDRRPYTGGYYWMPTPDTGPGGVAWSVVTSRDLGCGPDDGHDADLWPRLIERLAASWHKDQAVLNRRLLQSYTGLPRGRVTRPEKPYLILHGNDSPVPDWQAQVVAAFRLHGCRYRFLYDEHETMISAHTRVIHDCLGVQPTRTGG